MGPLENWLDTHPVYAENLKSIACCLQAPSRSFLCRKSHPLILGPGWQWTHICQHVRNKCVLSQPLRFRLFVVVNAEKQIVQILFPLFSVSHRKTFYNSKASIPCHSLSLLLRAIASIIFFFNLRLSQCFCINEFDFPGFHKKWPKNSSLKQVPLALICPMTVP